MKHLGNKPVPLELKRKPPQFGIDRLDLLHVSLGPSPVLGVRRYRPRLAFRCSWPGRAAAVQSAPVPVLERRLLAGRASTCLGKASLTRPIRSETRCLAGFEQLLAIN